MVSFYGNRPIGGSSGEGGGQTTVNVGVTAQEGYPGYPINLYSLADGNYNLIGSVSYGNSGQLSFLSYETFSIQTLDGVKYAIYEVIEDDEVYKVLIKMPSEETAEVKKIKIGGEGGVDNIIDDSDIKENTTFSSAKIEELFSWQTS